MTVAVRIRPLTEAETVSREAIIAHRVDPQMIVLLDPSDGPDDVRRANRSREKRYIFDHVFDTASGQDDVYRQTTKFLVESVANGYNGTVFAYGATGSGKTHTMLGTESDPGIYVRALDDVFAVVRNTQDEGLSHVSISYLEIYNEMVRDLLNPSSGYLEMREDPRGAVQVSGLSEVTAASTAEIMELLLAGNQERTQEPTKANKTSSRSHAVLQVTVKQRARVAAAAGSVAAASATPVGGQLRVGRLYLVDLAGSERAANTQNRGKRMVEGAHINRSLLALGNCINTLSEMRNGTAGYKYVNYRDSKLTRLLKDSLGGNCRTVMIAHLSPVAPHFEESRNTLTYADRAKKIKNNVRRNVTDVAYHVSQYASIILELREEINRLRTKMASTLPPSPASQATRSQAPSRTSADIKTVHSEVVGALDDNHNFVRLKEQLITNLKDQLELRRTLMELNNVLAEVDAEVVRQQLAVTDWELSRTAVAIDRVQLDEDSAKRGPDEDDDGYETSELSKQLDAVGPSYNDVEPHEVKVARSELIILSAEKRNAERKKKAAMQELRAAKQRASELEESLPKRLSTEEQKEIVALLLHANEMEIDNAEMQALLHMKENDLARKSAAVAYYTDYNALADKIIVKQHELIRVNGVPISRELSALYEAYCSRDRPPSAAVALRGSSTSRSISSQRDQTTRLPAISAKAEGGSDVTGSAESRELRGQHGVKSQLRSLGVGVGGGALKDDQWQREAFLSRHQMLAFLRPHQKPAGYIGSESGKLFVPSSKLPPLKDEESLQSREKTARPPQVERPSRRGAPHAYSRSGLVRFAQESASPGPPPSTDCKAGSAAGRGAAQTLPTATTRAAASRRRSERSHSRRPNDGSDAAAATGAADDDSLLDTPRSLGLATATPSSSGAAIVGDDGYDEDDPFSPESSGGGRALAASRSLPADSLSPTQGRTSVRGGGGGTTGNSHPRRRAVGGQQVSEGYSDDDDDDEAAATHSDSPSAALGRRPQASSLEIQRASALVGLKRVAKRKSLQRLISNSSSTEQTTSAPQPPQQPRPPSARAAAAAASAAAAATPGAGARSSRLPRYVVSSKRFSVAGVRRSSRLDGNSASEQGRRTPSAKLARKSSKGGARRGSEKKTKQSVPDQASSSAPKAQAEAATTNTSGATAGSQSGGGGGGGGSSVATKPSIPGYHDADIHVSGFGLK